MNSNFHKVLQHSKENQVVIAIFNDASDSNFWAGYIVDFNDDFFIMQHISSYGKKDGLLIEPYYKISRIDVDDYCKCLNYLKDHHQELEEESNLEFAIDKGEGWLMSLLRILNNETHYITRIQIRNNNRFSGFISNLGEEDFELKCIGSEGTDEGLLYFQIEDVTSLRIDDLDARKRLLLYHYRRSIDFYDE